MLFEVDELAAAAAAGGGADELPACALGRSPAAGALEWRRWLAG